MAKLSNKGDKKSMKLKNSKTYINLATAFVAECSARTRYEFVEYGARYNGQNAIADIIDKIAYQEFNHARMLYTKLQSADSEQIDNINITTSLPFKEKWDLVKNIKLLAEDEKNEAKAYDKFIKTAEDEGFKDCATLFAQIKNVELRHEKIFNFIYKEISKGSLYKKQGNNIWVCSSCGHVIEGKEAPEECPLCKAKQGYYEITLPKNLTL